MKRMGLRTATSIAMLLVLLAILAACGGARTGTAPRPTATTAAASGSTVGVALTDFAIEMPASIPAGRVVFNVTNTGEVEHNFEVEGQEIEEELETKSPAGPERNPGTRSEFRHLRGLLSRSQPRRGGDEDGANRHGPVVEHDGFVMICPPPESRSEGYVQP